MISSPTSPKEELTQSLLDPNESTKDSPKEEGETGDSEGSGTEVEPYSFANEVRFFFKTGIPLGLSSFFEWGFPPLMVMIFAGHTPDSETLQTALGFARTFWNITCLMIMVGMWNYYNTVLPGCIGAKRMDRVATYFKRSMMLTILISLPLWFLQLFSDEIMKALGVSSEISDQVLIYTRLMIITSFLLNIEAHLEATFINLGYPQLATLNSLFTGIGVDVFCSYLFIYKWHWGIEGAAYTQIVVKASRIAFWGLCLCATGVWRTVLVTKNREPLFSVEEARLFIKLSMTTVLSNLSGWLVFELQLLGMANIKDISEDALAAGTIWIQSETLIAATQNGWITVTRVRTLNLLGAGDMGSAKSFVLMNVFAFALVLLSNVPLIVPYIQDKIALVMSNEEDVRSWFKKTLWALAVHSQFRILFCNVTSLFIPLGKYALILLVQFFCWYCVAVPVTGVIALTDKVTDWMLAKIIATLICSMAGATAISIFSIIYFCWMDWPEAAAVIMERANNDKEKEKEKERERDKEKGVEKERHGQYVSEKNVPARVLIND